MNIFHAINKTTGQIDFILVAPSRTNAHAELRAMLAALGQDHNHNIRWA